MVELSLVVNAIPSTQSEAEWIRAQIGMLDGANMPSSVHDKLLFIMESKSSIPSNPDVWSLLPNTKYQYSNIKIAYGFFMLVVLHSILH